MISWSSRSLGGGVHTAAHRLLHGAFEGLVGGGDGQEEVSGTQLPMRTHTFVPARLSSQQGGGDRMKEGDAGRGEEAGGRGLFGSCGKLKEVLQGGGAPPH